MKRRHGDPGTTLVELMVGLAVASLVIGVIFQMQVSAWRFQHEDDQRFERQGASVTALDWIIRDLRMASAVEPFVNGADSLTLTVGGERITYAYRPTESDLIRTHSGESKVLGSAVTGLGFYVEPVGRTIRVELTVRLPDGSYYTQVSKGTLRIQAGG